MSTRSPKNARKNLTIHKKHLFYKNILSVRLEIFKLEIFTLTIVPARPILNVTFLELSWLNWQQRDPHPQPISSWTDTQLFNQTGQIIELCCEYLSVQCIWLYVIFMSRMRFKVNLHSVLWIYTLSFRYIDFVSTLKRVTWYNKQSNAPSR